MTARYGNLAFKAQIAFFRNKVNVPTATWDDVWLSGHDTGFMVAGATKADLLDDLRKAVAKGIEDGTTLADFRRDFEGIVERHGWTGWTGEGTARGRAWRTRVIWETNLRTSYAAGRWEQLQAKKDFAPYLLYVHDDSVRYPRPHHVAWDGLVLHIDDPWWLTHYPPNGWGCKCKVRSLTRGQLARRGQEVGPAPDSPIDPKTNAPVGIDAGWSYAPGASLPRQADVLRDKAQKLPPAIKAGLLADIDATLAARPPAPPVPSHPAPAAAFRDWFDGVAERLRPTNDYQEVGRISQPALEGLLDHGIAPESARVIVRDTEILHMLRDAKAAALTPTGQRKALARADVRRLPEIIAQPQAVLLDTTDNALIYVFKPTEREAGKLVVRVDYRSKLKGAGKQPVNVVRTGGLVNTANLLADRYRLLEGSL